MSQDLSLLGGENPANNNDKIVETTGQVKALNTGHTQQSLQKQLRGELDATWQGNRGLMGGLFGTVGQILGAGGTITGGILGGIGDLFGGLIEGVKNFVGGIAKSISGDGAGYKEIEGAVDQRLGPMNNVITESGNKITQLSEQIESAIATQQTLITDQADLTNIAQDALTRASALINAQGQPTGEFIVIQTQVNNALLAATQANTQSLQAVQTFNQQQVEINHTVQEQIWTHQDMIELLDIRTPKSWGYRYGNNNDGVWEICPWRFSSSGQLETYWKYESPYFTMYARNWGSFGDVFIGFKGQWQGTFDIEINWTNGALDNWSRPVTNPKGYRIWAFRGGAGHIDMRSIQVTCYATSLNRTATLTNTGTNWVLNSDINNLTRTLSTDGAWIRFKNGVHGQPTDNTLPAGIYIRDGFNNKTLETNYVSARKIYAADNPPGTYKFDEITDEAINYTLDQTIPSIGGHTGNIETVNV